MVGENPRLKKTVIFQRLSAFFFFFFFFLKKKKLLCTNLLAARCDRYQSNYEILGIVNTAFFCKHPYVMMQ